MNLILSNEEMDKDQYQIQQKDNMQKNKQEKTAQKEKKKMPNGVAKMVVEWTNFS